MTHPLNRLSRRVLPLLLVACGGLAHGAPALGQYDVDPSTVTVAGISSGGFMAVQMQVAFSSRFHGVAVFAGGPFYCAEGSESTATGACESGNGISVPGLVAYTETEADAGAIDDPSHLAGQPIYLFSGTQDTTVHQGTMNALQQYYETWVSASNITYDNMTAAAHGWISPDGPNSCSSSYSPYINNCSIDAEQTFLTQFYGALTAKNTGALGGSFVQFDQTPFCGSGGCSAISMDSTGWAFIPQSCASGSACKLVLALHGCLQYQGVVGMDFVKDSGLNEWADTNDVIVLYPQTTSGGGNPEGCWDWFGYTGANYALQAGPQMAALMSMVTQAGAAFPNGQVTTSSSTSSSSGSTASTASSTGGSTGSTSEACVGLGLSCASNSNCCQGLQGGLVVTCQSGNQLCLPSIGPGTSTSTTSSTGSSSAGAASTTSTGASSGSTPGTRAASGTTGGSTGGSTSGGGSTSSSSGGSASGGALSVTAILPSTAVAGTSTAVSITGTGFGSGDQVTIGSQALTAVSAQSGSTIYGTLGAGLSAGTYDVTVTAPSGGQAVLHHGFVVTGKGGGCASTDGLPLGGLLVLALACRRRSRP